MHTKQKLHKQLPCTEVCVQQDNHALSLMCFSQDGRTALHYAARWASQNAASALLAASASFTTVDNSGKTPLHLAVGAPVQEVDELTKQAMIKQGQRASEFLHCNNV